MVTYVRPGMAPLGHPDPAGYRGPVYTDPNVLRIAQLEGRIAALQRQVEDQAGKISGLQHQFDLQQEHHKELTKRVNELFRDRALAREQGERDAEVFYTTAGGTRVKIIIQDA